MTRPYFAYGTTQSGFPHHAQLGLNTPTGRYRTAEGAGIVVPREPACSNPGCGFLHRMAVLVPGQWNLHPEGDVFEVDDAMLAKLDALELAGPYVRAEVALRDGPTAIAYVAAEPVRWAELVWAGLADAVESYTIKTSEPKACCAARPGHPPPHDVIDPLDPERLADAKLANLVRGFGAHASLHVLEATAATTTTAYGREVLTAIMDWRASGAGRHALRLPAR